MCGFAVHGTVRAAGSNEPIAFAVVEVSDGSARAESDSTGQYRLVCLPVETHAVRISRLGYDPRTIEVAAAQGDTLRLDVDLSVRPVSLPPIQVAARTTGQLAGPAPDESLLARRFSLEDIAASPLVGSPDPLSSLPVAGALPAGDPLPGLRVRGGASSENLTLLDGVPIYNPYHAGGVSALSSDVVSRVTLYDDAAPAQWTGGLSSVVAMDTRSVSANSLGWDGSADPLWLGQFVSTRILGGAGDIIAGGRFRNGLLGAPDNGRAVGGGDGFARVTAPMFGGSLELLLFGSEDRVGFDTTVAAGPSLGVSEGETDGNPAASGNGFKWTTLTQALRWTGRFGPSTTADIRAWRTAYDADINWLVAAPLAAASQLRNVGVAVAVSGSALSTQPTLGVDAQQFGSRYTVSAGSTALGPLLSETAAPIVVGAFLEDRWHPTGSPWNVAAGLRGDVTPWGGVELQPRLTMGFAPTRVVALGATYSESRQYVQSVTNDESFITAVSGIALPVAADGARVPVAAAAQATAALTVRPSSATMVTVEGYSRRMTGLVLVASATALPFTTNGLAIGSGRASGLLVSFERRTPRVTVQALYALGTTTLSASGLSYTPAADPTQSLAAGVSTKGPEGITFRAAAWASLGRRTSVIADSVTWAPASELGGVGDLDGSPLAIRGPLDGAALPAYLRVDLSARREWSSDPGHGARFAGVVAITNLFGRPNVTGLWEAAGASALQALASAGRAISISLEWHPR
ncbi:MAG TPA: carboxypeptidase regulatory-like domain-containing protein [Gemmatimonadales bacterium]|nr:carboxypeptidase regulatory-like domain-containing protein [Gemmatimonadales bacterium]